MSFIRIAKPWEIRESEVTSETVYFNRRRFLKTLVGASIGASLTAIAGCQASSANPELEATLDLPKISPISTNPAFAKVDRPITDEDLAGSYNNFYEFGGTKNIWRQAQQLPTENWTVEVTGLVKNPRTYDLDDLKNSFP